MPIHDFRHTSADVKFQQVNGCGWYGKGYKIADAQFLCWKPNCVTTKTSRRIFSEPLSIFVDILLSLYDKNFVFGCDGNFLSY